MFKFITFLLLIPGLATAQHFVYADASFDPNKALGLVDNPRTVIDHRGFDFDLEVGAKENRVGVFIHYGRFEQADYQQYGAGVDYYPISGDRLEVSLGAEIGVVQRRYTYEEWSRPMWGGQVTGALRNTFIFWALPNVAITARQQLQGRPDINKAFIYEASLGIRIRFERNF